METKHIYKASTLGTCLLCGRPKQECESANLRSAWNQADQEDEFNKPNVFYQQIPDTCAVVQIVCTKFNTILLSNSGDVYSWGECTFCLGRACETREMSRVPELIPAFSDVSIIRLAAGEDHVLARDSNSKVWSWGSNDYGQLGQGNLEPSAEPKIVPGVSDVIRIYTGSEWSACLVSSNQYSRDSYDVFVWGDNRNNQLGYVASELGSQVIQFDEESKIKEPKILRDTPWFSTKRMAVVSDRRSKNMFYNSKFNPDIAIGGITKHNIDRIITENQDLKRRLEMYSKKIIDAEYKIYQDIAPDPVTWERDRILDQIVDNYEEVCERIKLSALKLDSTNHKVEGLKSDIKAKVAEIKEFEFNENTLWDSLDKYEDDKIQLIGEEESEEYKELMTKIRDVKKRMLAAVDEKKTLHSKLRELQEKIQKKSERISELETLKHQYEFEKSLLDEVREIRIKQIIFEFFEKNQNAVELDIKNLQSINEAIRDTSIEYLSTAVTCTSLSGFIQESNNLLKNLDFEISMMTKDSSRTALEAINKLWDILDDNVKLRQKLSEKIAKILQLTAINLPKVEKDMVNQESFQSGERAKIITHEPNEQLLKKILLSQAKSNKPKTEDKKEDLSDEDEEKPRTSTGRFNEIKEGESRSTWSWRACC